jgi:hypothetical protein
MEQSKEQDNENPETRSVEQVEICSCCGDEMTTIEVLESYLDQRIEQALEVCDALSAEYGNAVQLELLGKIAEWLVRAATITEAARAMTEGEQPVPDEA